MKKVISVFVVSAAVMVIGACGSSTPAREPSPWDNPAVISWQPTNIPLSLINGKALNGWVQRGGTANFRVENREIVGTTVPHSPNSFLCTEAVYGDFVLDLEFKVDPRINSGVQFRSLSTPEYQNGRVHGYQAEIDPTERAWTGGLYDEGRRGWLCDLKNNEAARKAFKQNEWNRMVIRAEGNEINIWINGVPTVSGFKDDRTREGFIALQVHDVGKDATPMEVRWRNITLFRIEKPAPK